MPGAGGAHVQRHVRRDLDVALLEAVEHRHSGADLRRLVPTWTSMRLDQYGDGWLWMTVRLTILSSRTLKYSTG